MNNYSEWFRLPSGDRGVLYIKLLYLLVDLLSLSAAWFSAVWLRFEGDWDQLGLVWYVLGGLQLTLSTLVLFYVNRLYERPTQRISVQAGPIVYAIGGGLLIFAVINFFFRPISFSRLTLAYYIILALTFTLVARIGVSRVVSRLHRKGVGVVNVLPLDTTPEVLRVVEYIREHPEIGYRVLWPPWTAEHVPGPVAATREGTMAENTDAPSPGPFLGLVDIVNRSSIGSLLVGRKDREELHQLVDFCEQHYVELLMVPDIVDMISGPVEVDHLGVTPILKLRVVNATDWRRKVKRLLDILISGSGLIVLAPVFAMIAIAIKLDSPGPVIFCQKRWGMGGHTLRAYKFRTMVSNAETVLEELFRKSPEVKDEYLKNKKLKSDPRVTRVGTLLRRTSLDELPQLLNVFRGDMSLVGPRPYLLNEAEEFSTYDRFLLRMPPGMTGLWQISGRNELDFGERLKLDAYYINNWSLLLDLLILFKTIPVLLTRKGAY